MTARGKLEWRPSGGLPDAWRAEVGRVRLFVHRLNPRDRWYWSASSPDGRRIAHSERGGTLRSVQLAAERWMTPTVW